MSMTAYWTVRARLLQVPGVANVTLWGERLQMLQVQVRPGRHGAAQHQPNQVMETTAEAVDSGLLLHDEGSIIGPGGIVETPNQRLNVRTVLPIITPDRPGTGADRDGRQPGEDAAEPGDRSSGSATSPTSSRTTSRCSATARSTTASA